MKNFVLANGILETVAGLALFAAPTVVPELAEGPAAALTFVRMYGAAALAAGILAFYVWKNFDELALRQPLLVFLLTFHTGVAIAFFIGYQSGGMSNPGGAVLHLVMAALTLYYLSKFRSKGAQV